MSRHGATDTNHSQQVGWIQSMNVNKPMHWSKARPRTMRRTTAGCQVVYEQDTEWSSAFHVECFEGPKTWRLVKYDEDGVPEEAVFTIQGVLSNKNSATSQIRYLRQSVTLTGLGTPTFEQAVDAAQEIYGLFDRSFEDGTLESWTTSTTQSRACMIHIPFSPAIDPRGFLEQMLKGNYVHGDDNTVEYYQVCKNQDGTRR